MINYEFYCPTKILFGKDTELKVGEETVKHSKNVLIVYGSGPYQEIRPVQHCDGFAGEVRRCMEGTWRRQVEPA